MSNFTVMRLDGAQMPSADELDEEVPAFENLVQPINYRVLLYPRPIPKESAGGIVIPEETRDGMRYTRGIGKILAVGSTAFTHDQLDTPDKPQVGDWVWLPMHGGHYLSHRGVLRGEEDAFDLRVVRDCDIEGKYPNGLHDVLGY